jgi:hypothetical protein
MALNPTVAVTKDFNRKQKNIFTCPARVVIAKKDTATPVTSYSNNTGGIPPHYWVPFPNSRSTATSDTSNNPAFTGSKSDLLSFFGKLAE